MDLAEVGPLVEKLGVAGVLFAVVLVVLRRYDKLAASAEERIKQAHDARVDDAKEAARSNAQNLAMMAQMMQNLSVIMTAVQATARALEGSAHSLGILQQDRAGRQSERRPS